MVNTTQVQPLWPLTGDGSPPPTSAVPLLQPPRRGGWVYKARSPDQVQGGLLVSAVVRLTPITEQSGKLGLSETPAGLFACPRNILSALVERGFPALASRSPPKVKCVGRKVSVLTKGHHFLLQHLLIRGFLALNPPGTLLKVTGRMPEKGPRGCNSESLGIQCSARVGFSVLYSQLPKWPVNFLLNALSWLQL